MTTNRADPGTDDRRTAPQTFRARALMASLTVKDLPTSVAWYRDALGFTVGQMHERGGKVIAASLKAGHAQILLTQDDGAKGMDRVKGEGFSLQFTTAQNVDELAKRITDRGGSLQTEPTDMPWGARIFRVQDPDGFKLVISSGS